MGQNESSPQMLDFEQFAETMANMAVMSGMFEGLAESNKCSDCKELSAESCGNCKLKICSNCKPLHQTPVHCSLSEKLRRIENSLSNDDVRSELEKMKNELTQNDTGTSHEQEINQITADIKAALETRKTQIMSDMNSDHAQHEAILHDINEALKLRNVSPRLARVALKRGIGSEDMEAMIRQINLVDGILTKAVNRPMHGVQVFMKASDQYLKLLQENVRVGTYANMKMKKLINGTESGLKFTDLHDVKVCPITGMFFVSEYNRIDKAEYIRVYGPETNFIKRFATKTGSRIDFIATNNLGEVIVAGNGTLYIFNTDGMKLQEIETEYSCLWGIVCDEQNRMYLIASVEVVRFVNGLMSEHKSCKVIVFDRNGEKIREFGGRALSEGICFAALDTLGNLLVSDPVVDAMFVFNKDNGNVMNMIPYNGEKKTNTGTATSQKKGICVDSRGYILVADDCNNCIRVLMPAPIYYPFALISDPLCTFGSLWGLDATKNGCIILADDERDELVIFGPA